MGNNLSCDVKRKSSSMTCSRRHSAEHRLKKDRRFEKSNNTDESKRTGHRNRREALFAGAQLGCSLALVATETPNLFTSILSGLCAFRAVHVGRNGELSRREIIEMVLSMAGSFTGSRLLLFTPNAETYMLAIGGFAGVAPLMLIKDTASYLVSCDPESLRIEPDPGFEDNLEKRARANRRDQWKMFTRILGWASQDGLMWGSAYAALLGTSVVSTHVPVFYSNLVKAVSTPGMDKFIAVRNLSSMLLLVTLIKTCQSIFFAEASTRMGVRVKKQLMKNILNQDLSFFDKTPEGVVLTQMSASNSVVSVVSSLIPGLMYCTAQTVTTFMILSRFDVKLALITIIAVPADMGMSFWYSRLYERYNEKAQAIQSKSATVCTEMIGAMRTVRMFGAEKQRLGVFWKSVDELVKLRRTTNVIMAASNIVKTLIPHATSLGMFIYAGHLAGLGIIDVTQLVTVSMYQQSLTSSFQGFTRAWISWGSVMGSTKRVFIFIDREPKQRKRGKLIPEKVDGSIEFQDVTFSYATNNNKNGEPVLQNFNLKIKPGQVVALVGPSGGGKTTVVSLLLGLYDPTSGQITIDGVPLHEYEPTHYHNNIISVVNQEPVLFSESVSKNVVLGLPKDSVTQEQIEEACEQAYAHDFVVQLDKGYDTDVGRRGCKLSGGQRQRVAIARALVRNPNILVLDEATSALDAESESKVQKAVDKLMKGRTTVIVAHRLSTVQKADRILVINEGKIVEDGTHQELLDKDGVYARLISKQLEQNNTSSEGNKAQ